MLGYALQALCILKEVVAGGGERVLQAVLQGGAVAAVVRLLDLSPPAALLGPVQEVRLSATLPPPVHTLALHAPQFLISGPSDGSEI